MRRRPSKQPIEGYLSASEAPDVASFTATRGNRKGQGRKLVFKTPEMRAAIREEEHNYRRDNLAALESQVTEHLQAWAKNKYNMRAAPDAKTIAKALKG